MPASPDPIMWIDADWLGVYRCDNYDEEDGLERLELSRDDAGALRFTYHYECHTNHGYDVAHHEGTIVAVDKTAIAVERTSAKDSAWEDMFKEHHDQRSTSPVRTKIDIVRIDDGRPVLRYGRRELFFGRSRRPSYADADDE